MVPVVFLNPTAANDAVTSVASADPADGFWTTANYRGGFSSDVAENWLVGWTAASDYGMTTEGTTGQPEFWPGDRNEDEVVDIVDLNIVLIGWGQTGAGITDPRADANGDGVVDIVDLNIVLIDWGKTGFQL